MNKNYPFSELKQKIEGAAKTLIILPPKPSFDQVAASLAFSLSLQESNRNVSVVCPSPMTVEFNHLVGVEKIQERIYGTDLVVSLNYPADQIEKVSYNDDAGQPNVVIQPKTGAPALSQEKVKFSYIGAGADLIMTFGISDLSQLNLSGLDSSQSFLIDIDIDPLNPQFGHLNIIDPGASSFGEIIMGIISGLNLSFSVDAAQNILAGLWRATQGLTKSTVSADSFETVSLCLRVGAQKPQPESSPVAPIRREEFMPPKRFGPVDQRPFPPRVNQPIPAKINQPKPVLPVKPSTTPVMQVTPVIEETPEIPTKPPADWFEPKIFKGNNFNS